jgi:hypothetical protein
MNPMKPEYGFFAGMVAGVLILSVLVPTQYWYINLILITLFGITLYYTAPRNDRIFYLVCAGELLVVAAGVTMLWAGLFMVWMLAGVVCGVQGLLVSRTDYYTLILFWGCTILIASVIQVSNHVILPLLLFGLGTGLILGIRMMRNYQFRKHYSGVRP